jgi:hypothetical protein
MRMRQGLKEAQPMPEPNYGSRSETLTPSGDLVGFDPSTGKVTRFPSAKVNAQSLAATMDPGHPGTDPIPADGNAHVIVGEKPEDLSGNKGVAPLITPTPPTPIHQPYLASSYRTHFKLLMRFVVPDPNKPNRFFVCSATAASSFHLLSAGHCIYNHDPMGNGSGLGAGYAAEIWAWPSQTDDIDPVGIPKTWEDFPWGVAKSTQSLTYAGWINNADWNWDFAFITLDRRIGERVGWMARETGVQVPTLYYSGYPVEEPYVPRDTPYQYPGGNLGNVIGYTPSRIKLSAYTYGGHSGGAVYRCCIGPRYVFQGVNSTSNRHGLAEATLHTAKTEADFSNIYLNDIAKRPPVDRTQLIEYVFDNYSKGLGVLSVAVGDQFDFVINAYNAGYAPAEAVAADIHLTKTYDVFDGNYVGTVNLGRLDANKYAIQYHKLTMPTFIQPGNYFLGWALRGANPDYNTDNNTALTIKRQLRVVGMNGVYADTYSVVGGSSATGTVLLTGPAPQIGLGDGTDVLLSSDKAAVKVPKSVHFNEGDTSVTFTITTSPVSQDTTANIIANLNGQTRNMGFQVRASAQAVTLNSLTLAPPSVVGSSSSTATASLTGPAPAGGILVKLLSSNAKAVVPANVLVNAGSASATFIVKTSAVTAPAVSSIKATYSGITKAATLSIKPVQPAAITLSPAALKGGAQSVATITLNGPAPATGANISLTSSNLHATVPKTIKVSPGSSSVTVTVKTTAVTANTTAVIKATCSGVSKSANLTIKP